MVADHTVMTLRIIGTRSSSRAHAQQGDGDDDRGEEGSAVTVSSNVNVKIFNPDCQ
jgi:hypothetical protein